MDKVRIAEYYDRTLPFYYFFWHKKANALHLGLWEKGTKNLHDALVNTNKFLATIAGINSESRVLDAGCGVGGSAIWLAKHLGARVTGITLSGKQRQRGLTLAKRENVRHLTDFCLKDFLRTGFPDRSFDIIWAIESVCHAEDKRAFLKEAYRVLKRGGRLVMADGFLKRPVESRERPTYREFLEGWALPNLALVSDFKRAMTQTGFGHIKFWDKTRETEKSSALLSKKYLRWYPIFKMARMLRLVPELVMKSWKAGVAQHELVKMGLAGYGIFYGDKS